MSGGRPYRRGVGMVLINRDDLVFVGRRLDATSEAWQMPQGGIDAGESAAQAAMRELDEEVGTRKAEIIAESRQWLRYDLPPELADKVWNGRYRGQEQKWFLMRFTGEDGDIDVNGPHPEFSAWKWLPFTALPDVIVPFKRPLYEKIVAEFADLMPRSPPP